MKNNTPYLKTVHNRIAAYRAGRKKNFFEGEREMLEAITIEKTLSLEKRKKIKEYAKWLKKNCLVTGKGASTRFKLKTTKVQSPPQTVKKTTSCLLPSSPAQDIVLPIRVEITVHIKTINS